MWQAQLFTNTAATKKKHTFCSHPRGIMSHMLFDRGRRPQASNRLSVAGGAGSRTQHGYAASHPGSDWLLPQTRTPVPTGLMIVPFPVPGACFDCGPG